MPRLALALAFLFAWIGRLKAQPLYDNDTLSQLVDRQSAPEIPPKPPTSGPGSFHGSQFQFLEKTGYAPAVDAMPVWLYSRTQKEFVRIPTFVPHIRCPQLLTGPQSPCYPEGGSNLAGDGPNPGTNVGISASPGEDCTGPGTKRKGAYTLANAFPTYVSASWCGNIGEWRIQYFNYYV
ncbi:MAG: hypothetical protein Q9216_005803 [Gyalolechia sp. 2 TL-2023]